MQPKQAQIKEGWTWLWNAKKWHYFVGGKSLCKRWLRLSSYDLYENPDVKEKDKCKVCIRILEARKRPQTFKRYKRYRFKKDYCKEAPYPLKWYAKKGEIVIFDYPGLAGTARFYAESDSRLIIMSAKDAFEYLEEFDK